MAGKYLMSIAELKKEAAEKLGPMTEGTYASYMVMARARAGMYAIMNPLLGIDVKFKPEAMTIVSEIPYPISEMEWVDFLRDAAILCEYMPDVYLLDGDKFSLPI